jgi:hypothetical protein
MFAESGTTAHGYLCVAGITVLILFLIYVFVYDHKESIDDTTIWVDAFSRAGLNKRDIKKLSHDESAWYYDKTSTCVGYGDWSEECLKHEGVCSGGESFGGPDLQAREVASALKSGGRHPRCPLLYSG